MSDRALKTAILVHSMNDGGAQRRAAEIANGLAAAGQNVEYIAVAGVGDVGVQLAAEVGQVSLGRKARRWYQFRLWHGVRKLREHLNESRPDTLLAASTNAHLIAVWAARTAVRRPVLVLRASRHPMRIIPWSRPLKKGAEIVRRLLDRWAYNQADTVIAVSEEVGDGVRALLREPERCRVLRNPVVTDQFLESLGRKPKHPWINGREAVILAVGRLVWQKGFDQLISAFAELRRIHPARLVILGEGRLREQLESQAEALGIADHVDMPGQVSEVGPWMASADVLVSSSKFEGSPAVVVEALAAGCPVVATRCPGGSVELLRDRQAGILVEMGDTADLAAAMLEALERPWDRQKIRQVAEPYRARPAIGAYKEILMFRSSTRS